MHAALSRSKLLGLSAEKKSLPQRQMIRRLAKCRYLHEKLIEIELDDGDAEEEEEARTPETDVRTLPLCAQSNAHMHARVYSFVNGCESVAHIAQTDDTLNMQTISV